MGCLCSKPLQERRLQDNSSGFGEEGMELYMFNSLPSILEEGIPRDKEMRRKPIETRFSAPEHNAKLFARNQGRICLNLLHKGIHSGNHTGPRRKVSKCFSSEETYKHVWYAPELVHL